jgi:competence CoiA-like predicted nuclease
MLTAILEAGERICLGDGWEKEKLLLMRERERFCCPQCQEHVILKLGDKRIYHFSHLKGNNCSFEHENESEYHLKGKLQLYQWLKTQGLNPVLEFYDSNINQRADITFTISEKRYAIEFQCSSISEAVFIKRTKGYLSSGYTPIWILGANQWNRKNTYLTSFSEFHYLFLQKNASNQWTIPIYCTETQTFILHYFIQPITIRNAFSRQKIVHSDKINFIQMISLQTENPTIPSNWCKHLNHLKSQLIRAKGSYQNPFLRSVYNNHLNVSLLPPYLGLPVLNSPCIVTPPLIWQTYLFMDLFMLCNVTTVIKFQDIYFSFMKRIRKNDIQLRRIPQAEDERNVTLALLQYIELLIRTNFLKRITSHAFTINQLIEIPRTALEQKAMEESFYKKYAHKIFLK